MSIIKYSNHKQHVRLAQGMILVKTSKGEIEAFTRQRENSLNESISD